MTDTTASESLPEEQVQARDVPAAEVAPPDAGTPVAIWILYIVGILAGAVLASSLLFVALARATSGSGDVSVDVSVRALVVQLLLVIAAGGTYLWRRSGRPR